MNKLLVYLTSFLFLCCVGPKAAEETSTVLFSEKQIPVPGVIVKLFISYLTEEENGVFRQTSKPIKKNVDDFYKGEVKKLFGNHQGADLEDVLMNRRSPQFLSSKCRSYHPSV